MAGEAILYGNLGAALKVWLDGRLGGLEAFASVPAKPAASFVTLAYSGGSDLSVTHAQALVTVDSYGGTAESAEGLAQRVRAHLTALSNDTVRGVLIYKCEPSGGIVWLPDPDKSAPRFRQIFRFVVRGEAI